MTRCDDIRSMLSELVDGVLDERSDAEARAHLETCAECRGLLQDLTRIRETAGSLGPLQPPDHLWMEIAGQLRSNQRSASDSEAARYMTPARQWLGLAAALVVITVGAYAVSRLATPGTPDAMGNAADAGSVETVKQELDLAMEHYENAISELETLANGSDSGLEPEVAETLRQNILVIDAAIAESRTALTEDPASQPARASLLEALSRKVSVLQATVALMNRMRLGDPEGAAEAAAGIGRKS